MPQVSLRDDVFEVAQRLAKDAGFGTVDDYLTDVVLQEGNFSAADIDRLFTPERLAKIDAALGDVRAGRGMTVEESKAELARVRNEWIKVHGA